MTTDELRRSVRSKLEAAIRAQRESWEAALGIQEITGYVGDIYAFVSETAGALEDDEAIPDGLVDDLVSNRQFSRCGCEPKNLATDGGYHPCRLSAQRQH